MSGSDNSINNFLNEINVKIRLSDFIGQYVPLVEKGNSFVGKCPFHNENTPSFNVNNEKSFFYCFGCKAGGNILNFITKYKNLEFKEGVQFLSNYSGVPYYFNKKEKKIGSDEKIVQKILNHSNRFFLEYLKNYAPAYNYINSRGLRDSDIDKFEIGYCPDHKLLIKNLESKGFDLDQIIKTDLLIKNKQNEIFGRFSHRVTFPIYNFSNNIVGFGGRTLKNSKIKYINSQENLIFKKSQILFGLTQNYENIRRDKDIFLVEGYMDVIRLHSAGIENAVSSLGTTLSEIQLRKLWEFSDVPFICFDGDKAGIEAAKKIAIKALKYIKPGKSLKFIKIPDEKDPDSFMQKKTKVDFLRLQENAKDLSSLIWQIIQESIELDTPEFLAVIDEKIRNIVKKIENPVVSKEYFKFLKSRKDAFIWNKNKIQIKNIKNLKKERITENVNEKIFILMISSEKKFLNEFQEEIYQVKLNDTKLEERKKIILDFFFDEKSKNYELMDLIKESDTNLYSEIIKLKETHLRDLSNKEKDLFFKQILNNLRLPSLINERSNIKKEILACGKNTISENLLRRYNKISIEIKNIQNKKT